MSNEQSLLTSCRRKKTPPVTTITPRLLYLDRLIIFGVTAPGPAAAAAAAAD